MMALSFSNFGSPAAALAAARCLARLILTISAVSSAAAEDVATYPSATIRIIVPYPAGGTADALPRIIGDRLQARWNQSVIIVNRPGAGGNIGAETVAVAEPNAVGREPVTGIVAGNTAFGAKADMGSNVTYDTKRTC